MLEKVSDEAWLNLEKLLREGWQERPLSDPTGYLPANLRYHGYVGDPENPTPFIPDEEILQCLQTWLLKRGTTKVFFLLVVAAEGDHLNYQVDVTQLNHDTLSQVIAYENIIAAQDYSWVLFIDEDGLIHVAGPKELFLTLRDCWDQISGYVYEP